MWQWVARGNIQQISYIPQMEQHLPFGLMLLRLGNVITICKYACMYVCNYDCMYVCVCMCVCVYVRMYVSFYAHLQCVYKEFSYILPCTINLGTKCYDRPEQARQIASV